MSSPSPVPHKILLPKTWSPTHPHCNPPPFSRKLRPEFAEDLFSSYLSREPYLEMCAWFGAGPLNAGNNEPEAEVGSEKKERREKTEEPRNSVGFIVRLVAREVGLLEDKMGQVFLGGISQGMATGLCALFFLSASSEGRLGGFLGIVALEFFSERIFGGSGLNEVDTAVLSTALLLMHGADDVWVPMELGRQARRVAEETMGTSVEWLEFSAAENDGHWIKEAEEFDRIAQFIAKRGHATPRAL
ncbi:hypothetical protein BDW72DRAFT_209452 [Aspergillus terricola var. indicus]